MASKHPRAEGMVEFCATCGTETIHDISVELRTENETTENAQFSREPYRIATCQTCGQTAARRMNNA
ncbi:DUF7835 family putative zinc beta-ribbon protein [Halobacterium bonnevillei]